ncbi:DUF397 domain-containing protein [Micromonospora sp. NBC_01699]|uniref:DUF397 domain-containing protein n=1 Tax=Micromonospora sp. NBC_01699 TaxID=2975984 RepID=UPI003FA57610
MRAPTPAPTDSSSSPGWSTARSSHTWTTRCSHRWRPGTCVEVADNLPGRVLVRDTKDRTAGTLTFAPYPWRAFVADLTRH